MGGIKETIESISERDAVALLKRHAPSDKDFKEVYTHSKAVQKVALRMAEKIPGADKRFISTASLLHDIGRFSGSPGHSEAIRHGIKGAEILADKGLPAHAAVAETHIGAGITVDDIKHQGLPLPIKDYTPSTIEEKIIAHADNLIFGDKEVPFSKAIERFKKELGKYNAKRFEDLKNEVEAMIE